MSLGRRPKHTCPECKSGATTILTRNRCSGVDTVECKDCGEVFKKHPLGTAVRVQKQNVAGRITIGRGSVWGAGIV
jgi:Zn ribbon nucleic-acid-binding protein